MDAALDVAGDEVEFCKENRRWSAFGRARKNGDDHRPHSPEQSALEQST